MNLPSDSCVVFDRNSTDYSWYNTLDKRKVTFVTRLKSNVKAYTYGNRRKPYSSDVPEDQKVKLRGYQFTFCRIIYVNPDPNITYQFLTNSRKLKASEVADLYKGGWKIELFFKWIKQNLKVKIFLGTSANAVLTQLWIALCVYLMLAYFKFLAKFWGSLSGLLRLFQLNIFERRPPSDLLRPPDMSI